MNPMALNFILNNSITINVPDRSVIQPTEFLTTRDHFCDIANNKTPNNKIQLPFSSFPQHLLINDEPWMNLLDIIIGHNYFYPSHFDGWEFKFGDVMEVNFREVEFLKPLHCANSQLLMMKNVNFNFIWGQELSVSDFLTLIDKLPGYECATDLLSWKLLISYQNSFLCLKSSDEMKTIIKRLINTDKILNTNSEIFAFFGYQFLNSIPTDIKDIIKHHLKKNQYFPWKKLEVTQTNFIFLQEMIAKYPKFLLKTWTFFASDKLLFSSYVEQLPKICDTCDKINYNFHHIQYIVNTAKQIFKEDSASSARYITKQQFCWFLIHIMQTDYVHSYHKSFIQKFLEHHLFDDQRISTMMN